MIYQIRRMATRTSRYITIAAVLAVILLLLKFGYSNEGFASGTDSFTLYYADWCPHCQTIKPAFTEWSKKGSMQINGKTVFLQMVEADRDAEKAKGKPVKGYPTFLLEKADGSFKEFDGDRSPSGWES